MRGGTVQTCGDECDVIRLRCDPATAVLVPLQMIPCVRLLCAAANRWEVDTGNSRCNNKRMHAHARRNARVLIATVHAAAGACYRVCEHTPGTVTAPAAVSVARMRHGGEQALADALAARVGVGGGMAAEAQNRFDKLWDSGKNQG